MPGRPKAGRLQSVGIVMILSLMAVAAVFCTRLELDSDIRKLLPDSDPALQRASEVMQTVLERTIVDVGLRRETSPEELGAIADQFKDKLIKSGSVAHVRTKMQAGDALSLVETLRSRAPRLLTVADYKKIEAQLDPDAVTRTVQELAQKLQEPDGAHLRSRAAIDPLGFNDLALAPLAALTAGFRSARLIDGRMISGDGRHLLVIVEPGFPASTPDRSELFVHTMEALAHEFAAEDPDVEIRFLGAHRATLENARQIQSDVTVTSSIGILVVLLLSILVFGRISLAVLATTPAVCGTVIALGFFAATSGSMSAAVIGFGAVVLGLTIDYAVHIMFRSDKPPRRALLMGASTTAAAFLALQSSSLPGIRDIGLFGATGIIFACLFALIVLPPIARKLRPSKTPIINLPALIAGMPFSRTKAIIATVIITPILAWGALDLQFDGDVTHLTSLSERAASDETGLEQTWGEAFRVTMLVVEAANLESALQQNDALAAFLSAEIVSERIREHASIAGILPAQATQDQHRALWRTFWSADRIAETQSALKAACDLSLFRDGAFAPFIQALQTPTPPLVHEELISGAAGEILRDRVRHEGDRWIVTTPVFTDSMTQVEQLEQALAVQFPEVLFLNRSALVRRLAQMVESEMFRMGSIALLLVTFVVFLWLGSIELTLVLIIPLLISLLWTIGLLGWAGVPISLANAIFVVFLFGVAVDYAIFLLASRLEQFRGDLDYTSEAHASVTMCAITTCCGFGALCFAGHPVMFSIGATALLGLAAATLATQLFVPALAGLLLTRNGPNGSPGIRNAYASLWVFSMMVSGGLWHLITRRASHKNDQYATIDLIRRMGIKVRNRLPIGRRSYSDDTKPVSVPVGSELSLAPPFDKACVIVANHESMYDIMAIQALPTRTQIMVKDWVWKMPVMGAIAQRAGYTLVGNDDPERVIDNVKRSLDRGISLLVFPEGTRSRDGKVHRFHNGAFAIARELQVPVVPITLVGTRDVCPKHAWWVGDHDIHLSILPPMDPSRFTGEGADRRMARSARDSIRDRRAELWLQTQMSRERLRAIAGMYRYLGPVIANYAASKVKRDPLVRELPRLTEDATSVLVLGSGYGLMTARLACAAPQRAVTAIDLDRAKLRIASTALGDDFPVTYVHGDLRETPLPGMDLTLLADVLHYWPPEEQVQILSRITAAMPAGGKLLFRDGCREGRGHAALRWTEQFASLIGFTITSGRFWFHSKDQWRTLLEGAGLNVEVLAPELGGLSNVVMLCRKPN